MGCLQNNNICISILRTFIVAVNVLNTILGLILAILGFVLWAADDCVASCALTPGRMALMAFAASIFILTLGISGIFAGLLKLRNWGIILHIWLAIFALIIHLITALVLWRLADVVEDTSVVATKLTELYATYGDGALVTGFIDVVQGLFRCCGSAGSSDFETGGAATFWLATFAGKYPCSCCTGFNCDSATAPTNLFESGCGAILSAYSGPGLDWTVFFLVLAFLISLASLIFAFILVNNRKKPCCAGCCFCCVPKAGAEEEEEALT